MLLIPMSVVLVLLIGGLFWWSVASGQFDDLDGPAYRILTDDDGVAASQDVDSTLTPVNQAHDAAQ